jgi:hypothetical protein
MAAEFPHFLELLVKFIKSLGADTGLLFALLGLVTLASLGLVFLWFKRHISSKLLDIEQKRLAKRELEQGLSLLRRGRIDEADVRFGTALRLWPEIVASLPERERRRIMTELASHGGGWNATELWLRLEEQGRARQQA